MPTRTGRPHEVTVPPALHSRGIIYQLGKAKKPSQKHVFVLRPRSLALWPLCPAPQETGERREDRKRAGSQRQREEGLDPPHPTEVSDHFQLREWGPGPGDGFSSRSCSPASPLEMDVVASYHLGPFTPRIKLLVCPLLAIPLQRAATVDTKAFESGLTAQSREH